jgi:hypothetical protein
MLKKAKCPEEIEGILCHSQHNERCVKQTTMSILKNAAEVFIVLDVQKEIRPSCPLFFF